MADTSPSIPTSIPSSSISSTSDVSTSSSSTSSAAPAITTPTSSTITSPPLATTPTTTQASSTFVTSLSTTSPDSSTTNSSTNSNLGSSITSGNSTATGKPSTHHGSTVSGGAVAGIAIATFIIGALLAIIGFWLYLRRKPSSRRPKSSNRRISALNGALASRDPETPMQDYSIVERADDSQLRHEMQNLGELIYQHVENHYTTEPYPGKPQDFIVGLTKCGYSERTEPSALMLGSLLVNPKERRTAIKNLIAWVILKGVDLKGSSEYSLLPDEIISFYRSIPRGDKRSNEQDAFNKSVSRCRQLSAHPLSSAPSSRDPSQVPSITKVVNLLHSILKPFIKPNSVNSQSQSDNLASIIYEGREFGMLLLAQPGTWKFGWNMTMEVGPTAKDQIVVFPSLEEVINSGGKERRRVLYEQDREGI